MKYLEKKEYFKEIKKIELKYNNILKNYNSKFIQIKNLEEEKKKFFEKFYNDEIYNPQFKFYETEFDLEIPKKLKELYKQISTKNDYYGFKKLYKNKIKSKIYEFYSHYYWGDNIKSTKYVIKYRGKPNLNILLKAKYFCKNYKRNKIKFKKISIEKFKKEISEYIYNLTKEKIEFQINENLISKASIMPTENKFYLNPNNKFRDIDLKRLKIHEIGTHYLRYYNGKKTDIEILSVGTSNYIETEEGLAVFMEKMCKVQPKNQIFIYCGRVIATYYTLKKSFYDVFKILKKYGFKDKEAFAITVRAKRNISDTSKKGGFTKDYVYYSGYLKIKKYYKEKKDLEKLFIGKIKIEDLKTIKNYIKEFNPKPLTILNEINKK
jgi:hypothetical protein